MAEKCDRFFLQAATDFCLYSDERDCDSSVGGSSSGGEDMKDKDIIDYDFNNNTRYVFV